MAEKSKEELQLEALEDEKSKAEESLEDLERTKRDAIKTLEEKIAKLKASIALQKVDESFEEFQRRRSAEQEEIELLEMGLKIQQNQSENEQPTQEKSVPLESLLEQIPAPVQRHAEQAYNASTHTASSPSAYQSTSRLDESTRRDLYTVAAESTLTRLRDLNYNRGNWNHQDIDDYNRIKYEIRHVQELVGDEKMNEYFRGVNNSVMSAFEETKSFLDQMGYRR